MPGDRPRSLERLGARLAHIRAKQAIWRRHIPEFSLEVPTGTGNAGYERPSGIVFDNWGNLAAAITAYGMLETSFSKNMRLDEARRDAGHTADEGVTWWNDYRRVRTFIPDTSIGSVTITRDQELDAREQIKEALTEAKATIEERKEVKIFPQLVSPTGHGKYHGRFGLAPETSATLPLFCIKQQEDGKYFLEDPNEFLPQSEMARTGNGQIAIQEISRRLQVARGSGNNAIVDFAAIAGRLAPLFPGEQQDDLKRRLAEYLSVTYPREALNLGYINGFDIGITYFNHPRVGERRDTFLKDRDRVVGHVGHGQAPDLRITVSQSCPHQAIAGDRLKIMRTTADKVVSALTTKASKLH